MQPGLENFIAKGNNGAGDLVWGPDGNGGYAQYYYTDGGGFPPASKDGKLLEQVMPTKAVKHSLQVMLSSVKEKQVQLVLLS